MNGYRTWRPWQRRAWRTVLVLRRVIVCVAGASAVEFAILAPVLVIGAFSTADVGMAVHQRMMIGQTLRAGAVPAMAGATAAEISETLETVASDNFTLAGNGIFPPPGALQLDVEYYCGCPESDFASVSCTTTCVSGAAPQHFYRLTASKLFIGVMLPDFTISGAVEVLAK